MRTASPLNHERRRSLGQIAVQGLRRPLPTEMACPCSWLSIPSPLLMCATVRSSTKKGRQSAGVQSPTWTTTVRPAGGGPQYQKPLWPE